MMDIQTNWIQKNTITSSAEVPQWEVMETNIPFVLTKYQN